MSATLKTSLGSPRQATPRLSYNPYYLEANSSFTVLHGPMKMVMNTIFTAKGINQVEANTRKDSTMEASRRESKQRGAIREFAKN
jgi:hypothetical protein